MHIISIQYMNQIGKRPTTAVPSKSIIQKRLKKNND